MSRSFATIAAAAAAFAGGLIAPTAEAAPLNATAVIAKDALHSAQAIQRIGYRHCCRHCGASWGPPAYAYYTTPRYVPSVVYYGPAGYYRPYPPIVVYDIPPPRPYWDWRWRDGYRWSRWSRW